jgi:hypothetical protein
MTDRLARDRLEGNPVANATFENQLEFAGASPENGGIVLGNAALKHRPKVVIDATSATNTDPRVAISQNAVPPVHMAPARQSLRRSLNRTPRIMLGETWVGYGHPPRDRVRLADAGEELWANRD